MITTSRSAVATYLTCPRKRFWKSLDKQRRYVQMCRSKPCPQRNHELGIYDSRPMNSMNGEAKRKSALAASKPKRSLSILVYAERFTRTIIRVAVSVFDLCALPVLPRHRSHDAVSIQKSGKPILNAFVSWNKTQRYEQPSTKVVRTGSSGIMRKTRIIIVNIINVTPCAILLGSWLNLLSLIHNLAKYMDARNSAYATMMTMRGPLRFAGCVLPIMQMSIGG